MVTFKGSETAKPKPIIPWKARISLTFLSTISDTARRSNGTINRRLLNLLDLKSQANATPVNGVTSKDITIDAENKLWFRLFTPSVSFAAGSLPVIIFFHGGCFTFFSPDSLGYDAFCRRLCRHVPAVVVSVNYPLTPEHQFPSQYDNGEHILYFLDENPMVLPENADVSKCFLAGDSAGANLAHNVAIRVGKMGLQENRVGNLGLRRIRVVGFVSIQPLFGGEERTEAEVKFEGVSLVSMERADWMWKVFLPDGSDRDHQASNVSGPNSEDLSGLDYPDTLVFVGGFDPLQDWQRRYHDWLKNWGKKVHMIEYPNMFHAFYIFQDLPESSHLITQIKDFINTKLS
ncbi:hypothetical protein VNO80_12719 [Phaseolus coccineus]|uniref:Alpha/beta hydrolase fold-3 domain-containing protein n=1 Tax=Phaseolus coccineus TaxID=3886 RepID=A0AAN9RAV4_PHACN